MNKNTVRHNQNKKDNQAGTVIRATSRPLPQLYYHPADSSYWRKDACGKWIKVGTAAAKCFIKSQGFTSVVTQNGLTEIEQCLADIQIRQNIAYAGPLAGHKSAHYVINNINALVTESPSLIAPKAGNWSTLRALFQGMFDAEQLPYFYGWLKTATQAVYSGIWTPGQMLALVGPVDAYKSVTQHLITKMLGNRCAKPHQFMTGTTQFNLDLFHAEHLMLEDEAEEVSLEKRRHFAAHIKSVTVSQAQRCHGKGRHGLTMTPIWRLTCSLNDDPHRLLVLPPLDSDVAGKIMILKVDKTRLPITTDTPEEYAAFMKTLEGELPAFLHFLQQWQIPAALRDSRFGIKSYHHAAIAGVLWNANPEAHLLQLIDKALFTSAPTWTGSSIALHEFLVHDKHAGKSARALLSSLQECDSCLNKLASDPRTRQRVIKQQFDGGNVTWLIKAASHSSLTPHAPVVSVVEVHPMRPTTRRRLCASAARHHGKTSRKQPRRHQVGELLPYPPATDNLIDILHLCESRVGHLSNKPMCPQDFIQMLQNNDCLPVR